MSKFAPSALALALLALGGTPALAGPTGENIVGGDGSVSRPDSNTTNIQQNSQRLAIEWDSFNLGKGQTVNFHQPSSSSFVLNQILDANASVVRGQINANGNVVLVNPNGLHFTDTATLNVGSLIASGHSLSVDDFMDGYLQFQREQDKNGRVINQGTINAATGGSVTLLGSSVENSGQIYAQAGRINLAVGERITVDFDGDGLMRFAVDKALLENIEGLDAAIKNTGTLEANGGHIVMDGRVAQDIFSQVVNNEGIVKAGRIENDGGSIRLVGSGGSDSSVVNTGQLDASAQDAHSDGGQITLNAQDSTLLVSGDSHLDASSQNQQGGQIHLLGENVGLSGNTQVNVSGASGGGEILVGGDLQGKNPDIPNAQRVVVTSGVHLNADATDNGDGGRIITWADDWTRFSGSLSARGGEKGGDGGFAEVSGKKNLSYSGMADLRAPQGKTGTLLLDPENIEIVRSGQGTHDSELDDHQVLFGDGDANDTFVIGADVINSQTSNVILQATNNITQENHNNAVINITEADVSLTLQAGNNISITRSITTNNGNITLEANSSDTTPTGTGTLTISAPLDSGSGDITLSGANNILDANVTTTGELSVISFNGDITGTGTLAAGNLLLEASGNLGTDSATRITTNTNSLTALAGSSAWITNTGTADTTLAGSAGGTFDVAHGGSNLIIGSGADAAGDPVNGINAEVIEVTVTGANNLTVDQAVTATSNINLTATGDITTTTDGTISSTTAGDISLSGANLTLASNLSTTDGDISLTATNALNLDDGSITAVDADGSESLITLDAGSITQDTDHDGLIADQLKVTSTTAGDITLDNSNNNVGVLAADITDGDLTFTNSAGLELGSVGATSGIKADAFELILDSGDLSVTQMVTVDSLIWSISGGVTLSNELTATTSTEENINITAGGSFITDNSSSIITSNGGDISLTASSFDLQLGEINADTGGLKLEAISDTNDSSAITQDGGPGRITASSLLIILAGNGTNRSVNLGNSNNAIGRLAGKAEDDGSIGEFRLTSNTSLTIDELDSVQGITTAGDIFLETTGSADLIIDHQLESTDGSLQATTADGSIKLAANISTATTQTYSGAVTLEENTTFTADDGGTLALITFEDTINSSAGDGRTLTLVGNAQFDEAVGGATDGELGSLSVTGTTSLAGNITTSGIQNYTGAVTLTDDAILATTDNNITFGSTIDGTHDLTLSAGTGTANLTGSVGDTDEVSSLNIAADIINLGGNVTTTATQTYDGVVILQQNTTLTAEDGGTLALITFAETVNSSATDEHTLTLNANAQFNAAVGGETDGELGSLSVSGTTSLAANITTSDIQDYTGEVTLTGGNTIQELTGSTVTFDSNVLATTNAEEGLLITGNAEFGGDIGTLGIQLQSLAVTGTTSLAGDVLTDGTQQYTGAVTLEDDTSLTATDSDISFGSTIDGNHALTLDAGTATVILAGALGGNTELSSLDISASTINLPANIETTGTQTYEGAVILEQDTTLTADDGDTLQLITFKGAVNSSADDEHTLTLSANTQFDAAVGGDTDRELGSLSVSGTTSLASNITTTGIQDYTGDVTLAGGNTIQELTGSTVTFDSNVLATTNTEEGLLITGNAEFGGDIGTSGVRLQSLEISGTTTLGGDIFTDGNQQYTGAVTLADDVTLATTDSNIDFGSTINGTHSLTLVAGTGIVTVEDIIGGNDALDSLNITANTINLGGNITTSGIQNYTGAVTLTDDAILATTDNNITFGSTIDGTHDLTLSAGTGTANLTGSVGDTDEVSSLNIAADIINLGGNVTTTATQTYSGAVILEQDITLTANDGGTLGLITFAETVNSSATDGHTLTLVGNAQFNAAVGGEADGELGSLSVAGTTSLAGNITTLGAQNYTGAVTLTDDATLATTNNNIDFGSTIDGAHELTLDAGTGTVSFAAGVGGDDALDSLNITASSINLPANITTTGAQTYSGAVTLEQNTTLTAEDGGTLGLITFAGTVNSSADDGRTLTLNANAQFDGILGGGTDGELGSLNVSGTTSLAGSITTLGTQNYTGALTLEDDATLATTDSNIDFGSTLDGTHNLILATGAGVIIFEDAVGGTDELSSLDVTASTINLGGNITTTNAQNYTGAVNLDADITLATSNSNIGFSSTIDGTQALTLDAGTATVTLGDDVGSATALTSLNVAADIINVDGNITTTGAQIYSGAVILEQDTILTANDGGTLGLITFAETVNSSTNDGHTLALVGNAQFNAVVGGATDGELGSLSVSGATSLADNITTTGIQNYTGAVTLTDDAILTTSAGDIDFGSTIDGAQALTLDAGTATVTWSGDVGSATALTSLNITADTINLPASIETTGIQTYSGAVTLEQDTVLTANDGGTLALITFAETVNSSATDEHTLTLNANAQFNAAVGGEADGELGSLSVSGTTSLAANITTLGTQNYTGAVTLTDDATLATTNNNIDFGSTIDGAHELTLDAGTGTVSFAAGLGGDDALDSLNIAASSINLPASITTTGAQTYSGAVTLEQNTTLTAEDGGTLGLITFAETVNSSATDEHTLTLNANAQFNAAVGGETDGELGSLSVTGATSLASNITTLGTQNYTGTVTLEDDATLATTNNNIDFGSTIDGAHELTLDAGTGTVSFAAGVGGDDALDSLNITASSINLPASITTTGAQTYSGAVTLEQNTTLAAEDGGTLGLITFAETVNSSATDGHTLTLVGNAQFNAAVGGAPDGELGFLSVAGTTSLGSSVSTTGTQSYTGTVTLAGGNQVQELTGSTVTFDSNVLATTNAQEGLLITGDAEFGSDVGTSGIQLQSLAVTGTTSLAGDVFTDGTQQYTGAVTLEDATSLTATDSNISFGSTIDGAQALTLDAGTAAITLNGDIGEDTALTNLNITADTINLPASIETTGIQTYSGAVTLEQNTALTAEDGGTLGLITFAGTVNSSADDGRTLTLNANAQFDGILGGGTDGELGSLNVSGTTSLAGSITTLGTQNYTGALTLEDDATLATTDSNIDFGSTLDGTHNLILATGAGVIIFEDAVGGTDELSSLDVTASTINLGGNITTTNAQNYTGAVNLDADITLATSNSNIGFSSTIDGTQALTLDAGTATVTLGDDVGSATALTSLNVAADIINVDGNITTTGTQIYSGAVILEQDTTLTANDGGTLALITFAETVNSSTNDRHTLALVGNAQFNAAVGGNADGELGSLNVSGTTSLAGNITTTGTQNYTGAVTLTGNAILATANNTINFGSTIDGTHDLTLNTGTGTVTFEGVVGGDNELSSLDITANTINLGGNITTSGTQNYTGAVSLNADATLTTTDSDIDFNSTINGAQALTLDAGTATVTWGGDVGSATALTSLNITADTINLPSSIETTGTQTYSGAVTLEQNTTLTAEDGGTLGLITFAGTVNSSTNDGHTLALVGNAQFDAAVGGSADGELGSLSVSGTTSLAGNITTTGIQDYTGEVTLAGGNTIHELTGSTVTFDSNILATTNTEEGLLITGNAEFGSDVGASGIQLQSLAVTGTTSLAGAVFTDGTQQYTGAVTLAGNATLATTNSNIDFGSTIDGAQALTLDAGTATVTFNDEIGGGTQLTNLEVTAETILLHHNITTTDTQVFNGAMTLAGGNQIHELTGSTVTFDSNVLATTNAQEGLLITGDAEFGSDVGTLGIQLQSLAVTGTTSLAGNVFTDGTQQYTGAVTLEDATSLTATDSNISFGSTIDGAQALILDAGTATVILNGDIGEDTALTSLNITADTINLPASIETTGIQTYSGAVTLEQNTALTAEDGGTLGLITFAGTVNSSANDGHTLALVGNAQFNAAVGGAPDGELGFLSVAGTTSLAGNITTSGIQNYTGDVTLTGGNTVQELAGSTVTFASNVLATTDAQEGLLITGDAEFGSDVGTSGIQLQSLAVTGTTSLAGDVFTDGTQQYTGAVTLEDATSLTAADSNISFGSTIDGAEALTLDAGTATVTFNDEIGGGTQLTNLEVTAETILLHHNITTTDTQVFNGAMTLAGGNQIHELTGSTVTFDSNVLATTNAQEGLLITGDAEFGGDIGTSGIQLQSLAVTGTTSLAGAVFTDGTQQYTGAVTLEDATSLTATGSNISFGSTIDGAQALTLDAGTATVTFNDEIGGGTQLTNLEVTAETILLHHNITTTDTQVFNGAMTLAGGNQIHELTGSTVTFDSNVLATTNAQEGLLITGNAEFGGDIGAAGMQLQSLEVTGTTSLASNVFTDGTQHYTGAVTLAGGNTIHELTGSTVTFDSNILATTNTEEGLLITGNAEFGGDIGTSGIQLQSLAVTGTTSLAGAVFTDDTQQYTGAVTLEDATSLTAADSNISFGSTINGAQTLTLDAGTATVTLGGDVGSATALTSLNITADTINLPASIETTGIQTYSGAVTLEQNTTLTAEDGGTLGLITFAGTVNSSANDGHTLALVGNAQFDAAVGGSADGELGSLSVSGTTSLAGNITTTGIQDYTGDVTLAGGNTIHELTGSTVTFDSNVLATTNAQEGLLITGDAEFGSDVGTLGIQLQSLAVTGTTSLAGNVFTDGTQQYTGAVTLEDATSLTAADSNISFGSTIDGAEALTLDAGTATVTFNDEIGGGTQLTNLEVTAETILLHHNITTTDTQVFNGAMTLAGGNQIHELTGSTVTFDSNVLATTNAQEGLLITGDAEFGGDIGTSGIQLQSLAVTGTTSLAGDVFTDGTQQYTGAVTLEDATSLTAADSNISFGSTIDGAQALTLDAGTATVTWSGDVGSATALTSLNITADTINLGGNVTTSVDQTYNGLVTLSGADRTLTAYNGVDTYGTITMADGLNGGGHNLTLVGNWSLTGEATDLNSLTVNSGTATLGSDITTTGDQTYNGSVILANSISLTTTNSGTIHFDEKLDGGQSLTLNATGGAIEMNASIGSNTPLANLVITDAEDSSFSVINLTGDFTQLNGTGTTTLNGEIDAANISLTVNRLTLNNIDLDTSANDGDITLNVDELLTIGGDTTIKAGTGTVTLAPSDVNKTIYIHSGETCPSGNTCYDLGDLSIESAGTIGFGSTVHEGIITLAGFGFDYALEVFNNADILVSGALNGGTGSALELDPGSGITRLNGGSIVTEGDQIFHSAVELGDNFTLSAGASGDITFTGMLNSANTSFHDLSITQVQNLNFQGLVEQLNDLTITQAQDVSVSGEVTLAGSFMLQEATGTLAFEPGLALEASSLEFNAETIEFRSGSTISFTTLDDGDIALITDNLSILGGLDINAGSGTITLAPQNVGTDLLVCSGGSCAGVTVGAGEALYDIGNEFTFNEDATFQVGQANHEGDITLYAFTPGYDLSLSNTAAGTITLEGAFTSDYDLTLSSGSGGIYINADITTTNAQQSYSGTLRLNADRTLTGSQITVEDGIDGQSHGLTVDGHWLFTGTTTDLASLEVTGETTLNDSITTSGNQSYAQEVTLSGVSSFTSTSGSITMSNGLDADNQDLTIDGDWIFQGSAINLNSLTVTGNAEIGSSVTSTQDQTYQGTLALLDNTTLESNSGSINLQGNVQGNNHNLTIQGLLDLTANLAGVDLFQVSGAATLEGNRTLEASSLTFEDTLTGDGNNLSINGNTTFNGAVSQLDDLVIDGSLDLQASLEATSLSVSNTTNLVGDVTTSGTQTYSGAVTLEGNRTLEASSLTFAATLTGDDTGDLALTGNWNQQGQVTDIRNLSVAGTSTLAANVTTTGNQNYQNQIILDASNLTLEANQITLSDGIDGQSHGLTVDGHWLFTGTTTDLASLEVTGETTLNDSITTSGNQSYAQEVTLSGVSSFTSTSGSITMSNGLDADNQDLTIDGDWIFQGSAINLNSLTVTGNAEIGSSVTSTQDQTYQGTLALLDNTTLESNSGSINLQGNVQGNNHNLTIQGLLDLTANLAGVDLFQVSGAATLEGNRTLEASSLTFEDTLDGDGNNLSIDGDTTFNGAVSQLDDLVIDGSLDLQASLEAASLSVSNTANLAGDVTTTGTQTYSGAVTLEGNRTLEASSLTFAASVTGDDNDLSIAGDTTFNGAVSQIDALVIDSSLNLQASLDAASLSVSNTANLAGGVTTTGTQTYAGVVNLNGNRTLQASSLDFQSTLNGNNNSLTLNTGSGNITASDSWSNLNHLTITAAQDVSLKDTTLAGNFDHQQGTGKITIDGDLTANRILVKTQAAELTDDSSVTATGTDTSQHSAMTAFVNAMALGNNASLVAQNGSIHLAALSDDNSVGICQGLSACAGTPDTGFNFATLNIDADSVIIGRKDQQANLLAGDLNVDFDLTLEAGEGQILLMGAAGRLETSQRFYLNSDLINERAGVNLELWAKELVFADGISLATNNGDLRLFTDNFTVGGELNVNAGTATALLAAQDVTKDIYVCMTNCGAGSEDVLYQLTQQIQVMAGDIQIGSQLAGEGHQGNIFLHNLMLPFDLGVTTEAGRIEVHGGYYSHPDILEAQMGSLPPGAEQGGGLTLNAGNGIQLHSDISTGRDLVLNANTSLFNDVALTANNADLAINGSLDAQGNSLTLNTGSGNITASDDWSDLNNLTIIEAQDVSLKSTQLNGNFQVDSASGTLSVDGDLLAQRIWVQAEAAELTDNSSVTALGADSQDAEAIVARINSLTLGNNGHLAADNGSFRLAPVDKTASFSIAQANAGDFVSAQALHYDLNSISISANHLYIGQADHEGTIHAGQLNLNSHLTLDNTGGLFLRDSIETQGKNQTYLAAVTLEDNLVLNAGSTGDLHFSQTLNGSYNLTLAEARNINLQQVGIDGDFAIQAATGTTQLNADISASSLTLNSRELIFTDGIALDTSSNNGDLSLYTDQFTVEGALNVNAGTGTALLAAQDVTKDIYVCMTNCGAGSEDVLYQLTQQIQVMAGDIQIGSQLAGEGHQGNIFLHNLMLPFDLGVTTEAGRIEVHGGYYSHPDILEAQMGSLPPGAEQGGGLTLNAGNGIQLHSDISTGRDLVLNANTSLFNDVALTANNADLAINGSLDAQGNSLTLNTGSGNITASDDWSDLNDLTITAAQDVSLKSTTLTGNFDHQQGTGKITIDGDLIANRILVKTQAAELTDDSSVTATGTGTSEHSAMTAFVNAMTLGDNTSLVAQNGSIHLAALTDSNTVGICQGLTACTATPDTGFNFQSLNLDTQSVIIGRKNQQADLFVGDLDVNFDLVLNAGSGNVLLQGADTSVTTSRTLTLNSSVRGDHILLNAAELIFADGIHLTTNNAGDVRLFTDQFTVEGELLVDAGNGTALLAAQNRNKDLYVCMTDCGAGTDDVSYRLTQDIQVIAGDIQIGSRAAGERHQGNIYLQRLPFDFDLQVTTNAGIEIEVFAQNGTLDLNGLLLEGQSILLLGQGESTLSGYELSSNQWTITGDNEGQFSNNDNIKILNAAGQVIEGAANYSGFTHFMGGNESDIFKLEGNGRILGSLDGKSGDANANTLDVTNTNEPITLTLDTRFSNIQTLVGNGDTLQGSDSQTNNWVLTGANSGQLARDDYTLTFTGFTQLQAGSSQTNTWTTQGSYAGNIQLNGLENFWSYTAGQTLTSGQVSGNGSLTIASPAAGNTLTLGSNDLILPNLSNHTGNLIIGGQLSPASQPLTGNTQVSVNTNLLRINAPVNVGSNLIFLASDIELNSNVSTQQNVSFISVGANSATANNLTGQGDLIVNGQRTVTANSGRVIAASGIINSDNLVLDFDGGDFELAVSAERQDTSQPSQVSTATGIQLSVDLENFIRQSLGLELVSVSVSFANPAASVMGVRAIEVIDLALFEEDLTLFGRVGEGVALAFAQCEEVEGCTPDVTQEELAASIDELDLRIQQLESELENTSNSERRQQLQELLASYTAQKDEFATYLSDLQDFTGFEDQLADELGGEDEIDMEAIEREVAIIETIYTRVQFLESLQFNRERREMFAEKTGLDLTEERLEQIIESTMKAAARTEALIERMLDGD